MVKIIIDQDNCISCGSCTAVAPELFKMDDDTNKAQAKKADDLTDKELAKAKEAADICPVQAIKVE